MRWIEAIVFGVLFVLGVLALLRRGRKPPHTEGGSLASVDALDAATGSWYRPAPVLTGQHEHLAAADLEEAMAFSITCADSGAKCPGKFVTESEKELMEHVKIHMAASHPEMLKNPPPPDALKKMIRKV